MCHNPKVSVIVPVYNGEKWLTQALQSVLNQTYQNIEIIVIDDGSTDGTSELPILKNKSICYYHNINKGVAFSRNFGIEKAIGEYIAFLDCDDYWNKNKIEIQLNEMIQTNSVWSQHCYQYFYDKTGSVGKEINTFKYKDKAEKYVFTSFKVQTSCFMIKSDVLKNIDVRFDESKTFGEDSIFYIEMLKRYPLLFINEYLSYFRIRENNAGFNVFKQIQARADIYTQYNSDEFYIANTSKLVKWAYKRCYSCTRKAHKDYYYKINYIIPYFIFKVVTLCM